MKKVSRVFIFLAFTVFLSSCFLFNKTTRVKLPNAPEKKETQHQLPEKKEKEKKKEETTKKETPKETFYDVALFVPLDIDNVVTNDFQVGSKQVLPSHTREGLSFYEGALMAIDSLRAQNIPVRLYVYDSRSKKEPLSDLLKEGKLDSASLIIGAVRGEEFKKIAEYAKSQKINFVSATYPNDGGVTNNPFLYIVNSTLHIHSIAMQSFAQRKFSNKRLTVIYKNSAQGKQSLKYMKEAYQKMNLSRKSPLHTLEWKEDAEASTKQLIAGLQKGKKNVILLTTIYPDISEKIIKALVPYVEDYKISIVGMPTLGSASKLKNDEFKGIDIYYGTVFPYDHLEKYPVMKKIMWEYFGQYHARPTKEALNGYETVFYFGHLLDKSDKKFNKEINKSKGSLATDYSFQPIYKDAQEKNVDYYENTRIYFLRERDGEISPAN